MARRKRRFNYRLLIAKVILFLLVAGILTIYNKVKLTKAVRSGEYPEAERAIATASDGENAKVAEICFTEEEIAAFRETAAESESGSLSKVSMAVQEIAIPAEDEPDPVPTEQPATELLDVVGKYYRGKMLVVKDASRVFVGVSGPLGEGFAGKHVQDIIEKYGAMAGVNASGFDDPGGVGNGGTPLGLVMSEGEMKYGSDAGSYEVIGFDNNNILHCGYMTGAQARSIGIRDSVCFGPVLVTNGQKAAGLYNRSGGYNPRTAIGQREDGSVLILMLEGRQISSIGTDYNELAEIMLEYGAVSAANLDGGASTVMYYKGELLTNCSSLYGSRAVPTAWLVKPE